MEITIDPEFQALIPPPTEDERKRLEQSIIAEGVRDPIITWNGVIIDGHNRYSITQEHGLECPNREREFANRDAAKIWIIENQFGRRNLSNYAKGLLALQLEPLYAAEAKRRQQLSPGRGNKGAQKSAEVLDKGETREKVAQAAGLSHDTIRKIKAIEAEAAKGNPKAVKAKNELTSGEKKSIHGAYVNIVGKPKQRKIKDTIAEDGRRICVMCGKPIDAGTAHACRPTVHKQCEQEYQREWNDASRDLETNVPVYSVESMLRELTASAENLREAWEQTIEFNESMGAKLTPTNKQQLMDAVADLFNTLQTVKDSETNV